MRTHEQPMPLCLQQQPKYLRVPHDPVLASLAARAPCASFVYKLPAVPLKVLNKLLKKLEAPSLSNSELQNFDERVAYVGRVIDHHFSMAVTAQNEQLQQLQVCAGTQNALLLLPVLAITGMLVRDAFRLERVSRTTTSVCCEARAPARRPTASTARSGYLSARCDEPRCSRAWSCSAFQPTGIACSAPSASHSGWTTRWCGTTYRLGLPRTASECSTQCL